MLYYLLENDIIQLPKLKLLDEVNKINSPKYCPYHKLISHIIEDRIILKN